MNFLKRANKGFTLTEVVVAIAVIVIISVTSLSVCASSVSIFAKTRAESRLLKEIDLYEVCFETGNFADAVMFAKGATVLETGESVIYYDEEFNVVDEENALYQIDIDITVDNGIKSFSAKIKNMSGKVYYEMPEPYKIAA